MNTQSSNPIDVISEALKELSNTRVVDAVFTDVRFLEFSAKAGGSNYGKGLIFSGQGYTKQLVFNANPDQFFSSETINLGKDKNYSIGNVPVLTETELGSTVTKSNLKQVGRLKGLIVDGSVSINQYLHYNGTVDRLGLGTEQPNAALSVAEMGVEVMIGTSAEMHGMIGTHGTNDLDIVTDSTARISIKGNGNIELGNFNRNPVQVSVNGKLAIGVKVPDPQVDLHVAGPVKLNNRIQMYLQAPPTEGTYSIGDIVWNASPRVGAGVGWVCLRAGSPGSWYPFGEIKERG